MDIKDTDIKELLDKRVRIITDIGYTYVGDILSHGIDYIKLKDKIGIIRFIKFENMIRLEEAR